MGLQHTAWKALHARERDAGMSQVMRQLCDLGDCSSHDELYKQHGDFEPKSALSQASANVGVVTLLQIFL